MGEAMPGRGRKAIDRRVIGVAELWSCGVAELWSCGVVDFRTCGLADLRTYGLTDLRIGGLADLRIGGLADLRTYGLTDLRTYGLTDFRTLPSTRGQLFAIDARFAKRQKLGWPARSRTASANSGGVNTVEISLARAVRGGGHDPNFFVSKSICCVSHGAGERGGGGRVCR